MGAVVLVGVLADQIVKNSSKKGRGA